MKKPSNILSAFIIAIFFSACVSNQPVQKDTLYITLDIDSAVSYTNDTAGYIYDFIFSPLDSNAIWVFYGMGQAYELNLADSLWKPLKTKFGQYAYGLNEEMVISDSVDKNLLWIANFHKGLIAYDIQKKSYKEFVSIKPVSSILFDSVQVFVGTWEGLFTIDRKSFGFKKSNSIAEIQVDSIRKIKPDVLLINEQYEYDYKIDKIIGIRDEVSIDSTTKIIGNFEITTYRNNLVSVKKSKPDGSYSYDKYNYARVVFDNDYLWIISDLESGIVKYDINTQSSDTFKVTYLRSSYVENSDHKLWFYYAKSLMSFDKEYHEFHYASKNFDVHNLKADSKYIYFNSLNSIVIYNQSYFVKNSTKVVESIDEEAYFRTLVQSVHSNSDEFPEYYRSVKDLQNEYRNTSNLNIIWQIDHLVADIDNQFYHRDYQQLLEIEAFVKDSVYEDSIKAVYYLCTTLQAIIKGELRQSLAFDDVLQNQFPQYRNEAHKQEMIKVAEYADKIDSIKISATIAPDEKLWLLGKNYYDLFHHAVAPHYDIHPPDMAFPFSFLESLAAKFPDSKYTDNARFLMMRYQEQGSHEGGDVSFNFTAIREYEAILKKFPYTDLAPEIYFEIIYLSLIDMEYAEYENSAFPEFSELTKYYRKGLDYADKLQNEYPTFDKLEKVIYYKKLIKELLSESLWSLSVQPNKSVYALNEPVVLTFNLKNTDSRAKSIEVYEDKKVPNFFIEITRYDLDPEEYHQYEVRKLEDPRSFDKTMVKKLVEPGESYTESWDITSRAASNRHDPPLKFILEEPGRYQIKASCTLEEYGNYIRAREVWITVQ